MKSLALSRSPRRERTRADSRTVGLPTRGEQDILLPANTVFGRQSIDSTGISARVNLDGTFCASLPTACMHACMLGMLSLVAFVRG